MSGVTINVVIVEDQRSHRSEVAEVQRDNEAARGTQSMTVI
jgi:hypothetical protein